MSKLSHSKGRLLALFLIAVALHAGDVTGTPPPQPQQRPLLVVDDSRDMEGPDGVKRTSAGSWPLLLYLAQTIGEPECVTWTRYRAAGSNVQGPQCSSGEFRVRPLTMTSPLIEVVNAAVAANTDRDVYLLTNGLDWRVEGSNAEFRVEMDVGDALCKWLRSNAAHDLVLGSVSDFSGGIRRRPLMLIGLIHRSNASACSAEIANLPSKYTIALVYIRNTERVLTVDDRLVLGPTARITDGHVQFPVAITASGVIPIPVLVAKTLTAKATLQLSLRAPDASAAVCATDLELTTVGRLTSRCTVRGQHEVSCVTPLDLSMLVSRPVRLELATAVKPLRFTYMSDALRRTSATLCARCEAAHAFIVQGITVTPSKELTVAADARR